MSPQPPHYSVTPPPYSMSPQAPPYGTSGEAPAQMTPSNFPPHFAPPTHGMPQAPATTGRRSRRPGAGVSEAPGSMYESMPPPTPAAVLAASMFLGVPLALATLVVAVLALR
jgi:hypothetical protein